MLTCPTHGSQANAAVNRRTRFYVAFAGAAPDSSFLSVHSASLRLRRVAQASSINGTWQPPLPLESLGPTFSPQPPNPLHSFWPPQECSFAVAQAPCPRQEFSPPFPCPLHSFSPRQRWTSTLATVSVVGAF